MSQLITYFFIVKKTREVWMLLLSWFGVSWVFPYLVKETLLGWKGSSMGKKRNEVWQVGPLCLFWVIWKARNKIAFEDSVLSIQRLKASFVHLLWSETKLWIKGGPLTLIDFIDWVGSRWTRRFFCFPCCFGSNYKGMSLYTILLWVTILAPLHNTILLLIDQNNNHNWISNYF